MQHINNKSPHHELIHLVIVTGEASGDMHAARLMTELQKMGQRFKFSGIGGDRMIGQGFQALRHSKQMAFLGLGEVIRHLPFVRKVFKELIFHIRSLKPQAVILVDYPGFNLRLAKKIKQLGIPVIYYISPQIWAWGRGRIKKIKKYIDYMLVLFPFEVAFYAGHGVRVDYVGHPLVDIYYHRVQPKIFNPRGDKVLGLLPGSRMQELTGLLADMITTGKVLHQKKLIDRVLIAGVDHIPDSVYEHYIGSESYIKLHRGNMDVFYNQLDAALVSSGTATLETAYFRVPMVIVYRVHKLTWFLGKMLVRIDQIGLANIVAEEKVADELLQDDFQIQPAVDLLAGLLQQKANNNTREKLKIIQEKLGPPGASLQAAQKVINFIARNEGLVTGLSTP
jgi:lipid-A-disaccharide synthase